MRIISFLLVVVLSSGALCQTWTEDDIKEFAEGVSKEIKDVDLGGDVIFRDFIAIGRMLIYQYDVPDDWDLSDNAKDALISNLKMNGNTRTYFEQNISVGYWYYKGNTIFKMVSISSDELSPFNFKLGERLSIKNHPKAKEVNLEISPPVGWDVEEGRRPNIVKRFTYEGNIFTIMIKENTTFFSRRESMELLSFDEFLLDAVEGYASSLDDSVILSHEIVTIDTYPAIEAKVKGMAEQMGINMNITMKFWQVLYEDKIVFFQAMGANDTEFSELEKLYDSIVSSVVFPEQYL
ncbi:MAG: hypothetical protein ACR2PR_00855 [Pseudohongiellaceae bacterium]